MTVTLRKTAEVIGVVAALCAGLSMDWDWTTYGPLVSSAEARIGRPLTPMSYAGVARRTTRRAYYGAAAAGAAAAGAVAAGAYVATQPGCTQVTDAYGRIYTSC
jgi:hypothetical protein